MALAGLRTCILDLPRNNLGLQLLGQKVPDSLDCEMSRGTTGLIEGPPMHPPNSKTITFLSTQSLQAFCHSHPFPRALVSLSLEGKRSLHLENQLTLSGDIGKGNKLGF